MKRNGLSQLIWSVALSVWVFAILVGVRVGYRLSIVLTISGANVLMLVADLLGLGRIYVRTGIITLLSLYPVIWRITNPELFPPGIYSFLYMLLYLFVLIGAGAVIAVYAGRWVENEKKLILDDVYYDEREGWKPLRPDDLPPPLPPKFKKTKSS